MVQEFKSAVDKAEAQPRDTVPSEEEEGKEGLATVGDETLSQLSPVASDLKQPADPAGQVTAVNPSTVAQFVQVKQVLWARDTGTRVATTKTSRSSNVLIVF